MSKYILADFRMRKEEKEYIESLGYKIIEVSYNPDLYDEISGHVDISYVKINDTVITSPDRFVDLSRIIKCCVGKTDLQKEYPNDIPYNVCIMGKNAIHNFKYTDEAIKEKLEKEGYNLIDVKQGYTKCSIAVIDENSCITSDIDIAKKLMDNGIDVLFVYEPDIKLLKRTNPNETMQNRMFFEYSEMQGFIGGAMARIDDEIILFGDVNKLLNKDKIINFIKNKGLKFKWFEGLDVIDYGSIVVVEKNEVKKYQLEFTHKDQDFEDVCYLEKEYFEPSTVASVNQAIEWDRENPDSNIFVRDIEEDKIVAEITLLPFTQEQFNDFVNNDLHDTKISSDNILKYKPGLVCYLLFSAIAIDKKYREDRQVLSILMQGLYIKIKDLMNRNITFLNMCSEGQTVEGQKFIENFLKLKHKRTTKEGCKIYSFDNKDEFEKWFKIFPEYIDEYNKRFSI